MPFRFHLSEDIFRFKAAVCIGAGIGVTPFASLLQALYFRKSDISNTHQGDVRLRQLGIIARLHACKNPATPPVPTWRHGLQLFPRLPSRLTHTCTNSLTQKLHTPASERTPTAQLQTLTVVLNLWLGCFSVAWGCCVWPVGFAASHQARVFLLDLPGVQRLGLVFPASH